LTRRGPNGPPPGSLGNGVFFLLQDEEERPPASWSAQGRRIHGSRVASAGSVHGVRAKDYGKPTPPIQAALETDSHLCTFSAPPPHLRAISTLPSQSSRLARSSRLPGRTVRRKLRRVYMDAGKWALAWPCRNHLAGRREGEKAVEERLKVVLQYEQAKQMVGEGKEKDAASLLRSWSRSIPTSSPPGPSWATFCTAEARTIRPSARGRKGSGLPLRRPAAQDRGPVLEKEQPEAAWKPSTRSLQVQKDTSRASSGPAYYRLEMMEEAYRFLGNSAPPPP